MSREKIVLLVKFWTSAIEQWRNIYGSDFTEALEIKNYRELIFFFFSFENKADLIVEQKTKKL